MALESLSTVQHFKHCGIFSIIKEKSVKLLNGNNKEYGKWTKRHPALSGSCTRILCSTISMLYCCLSIELA